MPDDLMKAVGRKALHISGALEDSLLRAVGRARLGMYLASDRRPWRVGYAEFKAQYLGRVLHDSGLMQVFREGGELPLGHGYRLDARVVEIPWVLSKLCIGRTLLLDAGSSLNYEHVLRAPALTEKYLTILTLAPEPRCYWERGVSYVFGDLRETLFRDDYFDEVACISTIEHVGMDNSRYTGGADGAKRTDADQFVGAAKEMRRILKPGGSLFITFPFGRYEDHEWFQQFDAERLDHLIDAFGPGSLTEAIFQYQPDGWQLSSREACAGCEFFDVHTSKYFDRSSSVEYPADFAAGERAVACLELCK